MFSIFIAGTPFEYPLTFPQFNIELTLNFNSLPPAGVWAFEWLFWWFRLLPSPLTEKAGISAEWEEKHPPTLPPANPPVNPLVSPALVMLLAKPFPNAPGIALFNAPNAPTKCDEPFINELPPTPGNRPFERPSACTADFPGNKCSTSILVEPDMPLQTLRSSLAVSLWILPDPWLLWVLLHKPTPFVTLLWLLFIALSGAKCWLASWAFRWCPNWLNWQFNWPNCPSWLLKLPIPAKWCSGLSECCIPEMAFALAPFAYRKS